MDRAVGRIMDLLTEHPVMAGIVAVALIAVHYGHSYITAISSARSLRRRDDAELLEKEQRLRSRIEAEILRKRSRKS